MKAILNMGGALFLGLAFTAQVRAQVPVLITQRAMTRSPSEPFSAFAQTTVSVTTNVPFTTQLAPLEISGYRFIYWRVDAGSAPSSCAVTGCRDNPGTAMNPVTVMPVDDVTLTAVYELATADADTDQLSDADEFTYFPSLSVAGPQSNPEGDGFRVAEEFLRGYHPNLFDDLEPGGVARRSSAVLPVFTQPDLSGVTERSSPGTVFSPITTFLVNGSPYTTRLVYGTTSGQTFTGWRVNGTRQADARGLALPVAKFTLAGDTDAVAEYVLETRDADLDGVLDWFELLTSGGTAVTGTTNADGDAFTLAEEFTRGYAPTLAETLVPGGVARRGTPVLTVATQALIAFRFLSQPAGIVTEFSGLVAPGASVSSPFAPLTSSTFSFGEWRINGSRSQDGSGIALNPAVTVASADVEGIAQYLATNQDSDGDGIQDWFELRNLGSLGGSGASDADGDDFTLREEFLRGYSPVVREILRPGGVSRRAGTNILADLRSFPRIRETLVSGLPALFFASAPTEAAAASATFRLDADATAALGDWDADGDLDLFVAGRSGGSTVLRIFRNGGSSVVMSLERQAALETVLSSTIAGIARPALSLSDINADGRADLAIGGSTGTVSVFASLGNFSAMPSVLATISTGDASAIPGFADTSGDGRPDLIVVRPAGTARSYVHSGNNAAPYSTASFAENALPGSVTDATSVSSGDITEDGLPDIVISDASGRLTEFHRLLAGGYQLASRLFAGTFPGYANRLAGALGDLDGDGDGDVVAGFAEGGLVYLRNQVQKLAIEPTVRTLLAGQAIPFTLRDTEMPGAVPPLQWRFVANRSGGTLGSQGAYVSGSTSRVVDIIEAEDARGVTGRSYVNVISAADQTQVGKAIIVAGGLGTSDSVWGATRSTANRMYRALLHRGYRRENIRYMSLAYGEALESAAAQAVNDLDGNGIANDELYGLPLRGRVKESITEWAGGAADLVLIMVDHGVDDTFILDGTERLSSAELDAWLDSMQARGGRATLIMDSCFSGSFLGPLSSSPGPERIVLTSTRADQASFLFDGGEVSFTQAVARGVFQGFDLKRTFLQAEASMAEHQAAQLDDNGSGSYQAGIDGTLAEQRVIGPTYLVGQDIPVIEAVSASVPSPDGSSVIATSGAEGSSGVVSVHPLARVWCTVEAPGAAPATDPQANLPEIPLEINPDTRVYEATVSGFTEPGSYRVSCYVKDIHNSVSFPATTVATRAQAHEARLVIVVAGETGAPEWTEARAIGDAAFDTAIARGYLPQQIYYLTRGATAPANGCSTNCAPGSGTMATALGTWLATPTAAGLPAANEVSLFLLGSGGSGALTLGTGETLAASQLDAWLDAFQDAAPASTVRPVNVVLDHGENACSGQGQAFNLGSPATCTAASLIQALAPQGSEVRRDRAVFVSSGLNQPNARIAGGLVSFAQLFLSHSLENRSLGDATRLARGTLDLVTRASGVSQRPYFDFVTAGGGGTPGVPNELRDLSALRARFLGGLVRSTPPRTTGMTSLQSPVGTSVQIYVKADNTGDAAPALQAIVTPPGALVAASAKAAPRAKAQTLALIYNPTTDRYEGEFTPTTAGEHSVLIYEAASGLTSVPDEALLMVGGTQPSVFLATATQTVEEGQFLVLTAQLSQPRSTRTVVPFTLTGNAALQVDYDLDELQFVFPPNAASANVRLRAANDGLIEGSETLVLALGEAEGAIASPPTEATVVIGDNIFYVFADGFESSADN